MGSVLAADDGRNAGVQKTAKDETVAGLQPETVGDHASTRLGPISVIAATLRYLVRPRTRRTAAASAELEETSKPERDRSAYRNPMEAGITGGFSLLMGNPGVRKRR